jgi:hypothetical protein
MILGMILLFFLMNPFSQAAMAPEDWTVLPQVDFIYFGSQSVGLVTADGDYLKVSKDLKEIKSVTPEEFKNQFPTDGPLAREATKDKGATSAAFLRTSSGLTFKIKSAYCGEGEREQHLLWKGEEEFPDVLAPCSNISALEQVGDSLWLGTYERGEYGYYPAEGVVIETLDGTKKKGKVEKKMAGSVVRMLRKDPAKDEVWIATQLGLSVADSKGRVLRSAYFYQGFNEKTGVAQYSLIPEPQKNDLLAEISKRLHLKNPLAFYEILQKLDRSDDGKFAPSVISYEYPDYLEPQWNVLVPFFLEALNGSNEEARAFAAQEICLFNDPRAIEAVLKMRVRTLKESKADYGIRQCYRKYSLGLLLSKEQKSEMGKALLGNVKAALLKVSRSGPHENLYLFTNDFFSDVRDLKDLEDPSGFQEINSYFRTCEVSKPNASLFEMLIQEFKWEDKIMPSIISGLGKFKSDERAITAGCDYFDLNFQLPNFSLGNRQGAESIRAIVDAVVGFQEANGKKRIRVEDDFIVCGKVVQSQWKNEKIRKAIKDEMSSNWTDQEKKIFQSLLSAKTSAQ